MHNGRFSIRLVDRVIPQGALARYERDITVKSHETPESGSISDRLLAGEEVTVPSFELVSWPRISLSPEPSGQQPASRNYEENRMGIPPLPRRSQPASRNYREDGR